MNGNFIGDVLTNSAQDLNYGIIDIDNSNKEINKLLNECKIKGEEIIKSKLPLLKELTLKLLEEKQMSPISILNIAKKYYPEISNENSSYIINENYSDILKEKFETIK